MRVIVDFDVCASTGSCMQVCPEVFEVPQRRLPLHLAGGAGEKTA